MTSSDDTEIGSEAGDVHDTVRRRDAGRTRESLLIAAKELFGAKGYASTTLRQIGDHAGVDPALIARYFGSKTAIFIASLDADGSPSEPSPATPVSSHEVVDHLIERITSVGASPLLQAVVRPTTDDDVHEAARRIIQERIVAPLMLEIDPAVRDRNRLHAEIAVAALTGIVLARSAATFETLAAADHDDVVELALRTIRAVLED